MQNLMKFSSNDIISLAQTTSLTNGEYVYISRPLYSMFKLKFNIKILQRHTFNVCLGKHIFQVL